MMLGVFLSADYQVPRETVVAEYSGGKILYGDIEDRIAKIPPMYQTKYRTEDGMNSLLDMMCTEEVFYLEAVERNLQDSENFQEHSDMQIMSLLNNEYRKDMLKENVTLTEEEKQDFFKQHAEDYYAGRIYEEVASEVENRLRAEKEQDFDNKLYEDLKIKYEVVINDSIVGQIDLENLENNSAIEQEKLIASSNQFIEKDVQYLINIFPELSPQQKQQLQNQNALINYINDMAQTWVMAYEAIEKGYQEREDLKDTIDQIKRNVLLRSIYNILVVDAVQITDSLMLDYYNTNIAEYSNKATRKIQVFSFTTEEQAEKILKKAQKALKKNNTEELNTLVNENCTYTNNNGVIGNIYDNGIIPGFGKDEVFSEKVWMDLTEDNSGKFSEIFATNKGDLVFFRILEDIPAQPQPFEEVKNSIASKLNKEQTRAKFDEVTAELKNKYNVVTYYDRLFIVLPAEDYFNFAEEAQKKRRYQDAIYYYDKVIKNHKNNVDDYKALFMKGFLYAEELNKKDLALEVFNELLNNYEEGDLHESAHFMILELEGKSNIMEAFEDENQKADKDEDIKE
jgi:tetratricopeptide (TPR) repeat protein